MTSYIKTALIFLFTIPCVCNGEIITKIDTNNIKIGRKYVIYLHGKIIEDQGIPAISNQYGEYKYDEILQSLSNHGLCVISEKRNKNTNIYEYAEYISDVIKNLIDNGVLPEDISVIGASKGAAIAICVSHILDNKDLNFILLSICCDKIDSFMFNNNIQLSGYILHIYDESDSIAERCTAFKHILNSNNITKFNEIQTKLGLGHGLLYQPFDEWIKPTIKWIMY